MKYIAIVQTRYGEQQVALGAPKVDFSIVLNQVITSLKSFLIQQPTT